MSRDKKIQEILNSGVTHNQFDITNYIYTRLQEYGYEKMTTPLKIGLKITNKCNFSCIYCFTQKNQSIMPISIVKKLVQDLKQKPYEIYLTGGDPLLHPDIFKIIDYLYSSGIQIKIHTTGLLDNEKMILLNKAIHKIASIQISIDSIQDFQILRRSNISSPLEKIKWFVKNLLEPDKIIVNTVVSNYNYNQLKDIINYLYDIGLKKIRFSPIFCSNKTEYRLDDELIDLYYETIMYAKQKNIVVISDPFAHPWSLNQSEKLKLGPLFCPAQKSEIEIDCEGNVYPCPFLHDNIHKMGNLLEENINEIWKNGVSALEKKKWSTNKLCVNCKEYDLCGGGCYAAAYTNHLDYDGRCLKHEKISG